MKYQVLPIFIACITALFLVGLFASVITFLNFLPVQKISLHLLPIDMFVGITIYLKTSIDFALFTGNVMAKFPGVKNRIAIEIGTALGNGLGTLLVLVLWTFFKEIPLLLFLMIFLASLVLLDLARESLEAFIASSPSAPIIIHNMVLYLYTILVSLHKRLSFFFRLVTLHPSEKAKTHNGFLKLFVFALSIPFILGLDDFAGYVPLFSLVHVFGFSVGVVLGHVLLTLSLFAFPHKTIQLVRNPLLQLFGGVVFVGLALFGLLESMRILLPLLTLLQK